MKNKLIETQVMLLLAGLLLAVGCAAPGASPAPTAVSMADTPTPTAPTGVDETIKKGEAVTITIVYDNYVYDSRLETGWGFAALVEHQNRAILFDTGGDGAKLLGNMAVLGIAPASVDAVVLSHIHADHTGGLGTLLASGAGPSVYVPPSFPSDFKGRVGRATEVVEVSPGLSVSEGIYTTGELGSSIKEQALLIQTGEGLVVVTGCAHPGIVQILERAVELFGEEIYLVLGGFHLGSKSEAEIASIVSDFRRLGVDKVAPCHCTGDGAIEAFAGEYGGDFVRAGVGRVIVIGQ